MKVIVPEAVKTNLKEGLHMAKLEGFDRIIGMDLSKRTFKACLLTREKNFEDRKIFSGSMTMLETTDFNQKMTTDFNQYKCHRIQPISKMQ